jgi:triosephosphate isomerase
MRDSIFGSKFAFNAGEAVRRPLIAGNWKMNLNRADAVSLAKDIAAVETGSDVDVLVCPTSVYLDAVGAAVSGSKVAVGGQDVYFEASGAFTGEVSTSMLQDVGCSYVILGHSERRHVMGECDGLINKKVVAALAAGLTPVLCLKKEKPGKLTMWSSRNSKAH